MQKFAIVINNKFTKTMTAEAAYCNYGINILNADSKGIVRKGNYEYKITAN